MLDKLNLFTIDEVITENRNVKTFWLKPSEDFSFDNRLDGDNFPEEFLVFLLN